MRRRIAVATLSLVAACASVDQHAQRPALACFAPESLRLRSIAFGTLGQDTIETGDWSGLEVRFGIDSSGALVAAIRDARGELPPVRRVDSLHYDAGKDSLWFKYNSGGATSYEHQLRPGCTQLIGVARLFVTKDDPTGTLRQVTLPRILHPPPDRH